MYKKILAITFTAFLVTACGSSSDDDSPSGTVTPTDTGTDTTDTGGEAPPPVGGETGEFLFGDSANEANGIDGTFPLCPSNINGSFSSFAQDPAGNFCVPGCPDGVAIENADGDDFATFPDENGNLLTCTVIAAAPGAPVNIELFAPIDGCPAPLGCPPGTFPRVFISANAGSELAGSYTCTPWLFDQVTQVWGQEASPAAFTLSLSTDFSAVISGTPTTWSFSSGVLTLEGNMTFNNVAVGPGSFSSYLSNTALTRCET